MAEDPHAEQRAGGSADPDEPGPGAGTESAHPEAAGPGVGTEAPGSTLTPTLQSAAHAATDGLQEFGKTAFDGGEAAIPGVLSVVDAAQTAVSNALSAATANATGNDAPEAPAISTDVGSGLTPAAQNAAEKLLAGLQTFANEVFAVPKEGLDEALKVIDHLQTEVSSLFSRTANIAQGKGLGG